MGKIVLDGMEFYAYHGFYEEEQLLGNHFIVDIEIETDIAKAGSSDDTNAVFNYENVHWVTKFEMVKKVKLLETLAERIAASLKNKFDGILGVNVRVYKKNPPLGGRVEASYVDNDGKIGLKGMEFHAPIGFSEEEQLLGNDFIVDITVQTNTKNAASSDDLQKTINYESIFLVTKMEMSKRARLLENVAHRIVRSLKEQYATIKTLEVSIRKKNPAVYGQIPEAAVEVEVSHVMQCGRCKSEMLCYKGGSCWCHDIPVFPANRKLMAASYKGCLCKTCLGIYAG